nr:PREDICTED: UPF0729 protein AGAP000931 [Bemisia tabaci]
MVCLPCVAVPLLLFLWRILSPFILRFIPWGKPEPGEKAIDNKEKSPISCDSTGCYWSRPKVPAEESKCPIESDKVK